MHADQKLYLVFEFLDVDLKRYMENANKAGRPISSDITKVSKVLTHCCRTKPLCSPHFFSATHLSLLTPTSDHFYAYMTRSTTVCRVATRPQARHYRSGT